MVTDALRESVGGHPLVAETLARRGLLTPEAARGFLDPAAYHPASPFELPDMERAIERIRRAIRDHELLGVWGDFDVDGQTSTSLLVSALRDLGAEVMYHVPHRQHEGHGINLPHLQQMIDQGARLIVTCDTGIAAHEAVDYAQARGLDVIVTDHHHLAETLPAAYAVINPQRLPEDYPLHELPGVGVAYKLIEGLTGERADLLDLVALGIVADVALQVRDTRYLLQRGLERLRVTERLGLQAVLELAKVDPAQLTEMHIGFSLAPRLNALGRLEDASLAVELLTTHDREQARVLAQRLEALNAQRKLLTDQVYGAAVAQIAQDRSMLDAPVLILTHPQWHGGVLGIVANRLVEEFSRPVILLVTTDQQAHGSARSVEGVDITAALTANAHLLTTFGGHTMAAGLSLPIDNIAALRRGLARVITLPTFEPTLAISGYVTLLEITLDLIADLERLAPFGAGNPPLILAAHDLTIRSHSKIGRSGHHTGMTVVDQAGNSQRVIWWQSGDLPVGRIDLAFSARATDYKGERQLQIEWIGARPAEGVVQVSESTIEIVDYRTEPQQLSTLKGVQIWREADPSVSGQTRLELTEADKLAIWTIPPGSAELRAVIEQVKPQTIYLFAADPGLDTLESFVKRLAGLVKYALSQRGSVVTLAELAAATAQRAITVRAGLGWLVARGQIGISAIEGDTVILTESTGEILPNQAELREQLAAHLRETTAFRAFYRRADASRLFKL